MRETAEEVIFPSPDEAENSEQWWTFCHWLHMFNINTFLPVLSCRVLQSVARGHDTKGPAHVQTRHPRLCRHRVRHRPFENPYPRIARRGCRNGQQDHPRGKAAGAGALLAFVTDTDLSCKILDDLNCGHVQENLNGRQVIVVYKPAGYQMQPYAPPTNKRNRIF